MAKIKRINESCNRGKKKRAKDEDECACEDEEFDSLEKHVTVDQVNQFTLQVSDEELENMRFPEILAELLNTTVDNIDTFKRAGGGWKVFLNEPIEPSVADMHQWRDYRDEAGDDDEDWRDYRD